MDNVGGCWCSKFETVTDIYFKKIAVQQYMKKICNSETKSSCLKTLQYFRTSKYKEGSYAQNMQTRKKRYKKYNSPNLYIFLFSGEEPGYEVILLPNMVWHSNLIPSFIYNASQKRNQIVAHVGLADHSTGEWRSDTVSCLTFRTLPIPVCQQL